MSDTHSKQLKNAHAVLEYVNTRNWDALAELLSPEFTHQILPSSIPSHDGKETRGKEEFVGLVSTFSTNFEKLTLLPPIDVIHGKDAVVIHFKSDGVTKSGVKFNNEYIATFHFDGEKIVRLKEFVDSKHTTEFLGAIAFASSTEPSK
ncbi:hypothetical protein DFH08DRAFT_955781 [Mycena albidolilacea]|uniref:SnoaL-like domain-containing protein n=1 Tax=Mycena albidolilacea TaxID=1033008 RepID=A0AAD7EVL0_9AGAR|nr:hypothetical protein DFH08DRAFT_955781 [Mycena albidolilacea]